MNVPEPKPKKPPTPNPAQRRTKTESEAVRKAGEQRRIVMPLIVIGARFLREITVHPAQYSRLDVDPSYQRGKTSEVQDLITVLQNGGPLIGEIILAERTYGSETERHKWWIVDGHQRVSAYQALDRSFAASVWQTDSLKAEASLFEAANVRKALTSQQQVKAWPGPGAEMLRRLSEDANSSLFNRIGWNSGAMQKHNPANLIYGMKDLLTGLKKSGGIQWSMARVDPELASPRNQEAARIFLEMMGVLAPTGYLRCNVVRAFASIARSRWLQGDGRWVCAMPKEHQMQRLRQVNWLGVVPALTERFQVVLVDYIKGIWR